MALCLCLVLFAPPVLAKGAGVQTGLNEVTLDVVTPHVAWGKPLDGGPIRALFIAPRFTLRDVVELAQRLELEFDTVPLWDAHHLGCDPAIPEQHVPGASPEETAGRLRDALKKERDLIVLGNFEIAILADDVLSAVVDHVESGGGLLLAQTCDEVPPVFGAFLGGIEDVPEAGAIHASDSSRYLTEGIAEPMTPEWGDGLDFVHAGTFGAGRVVRLDYPGPRPRLHFLLPALTQPFYARQGYLDTYFSLVAKAARWAAGREPEVWVQRIELAEPTGPEDEQIPPDLPEAYVQAMRDAVVRQPYRPFVVHLNAPADRDLRVQAQVREPERGLRMLYPYETVLPAGQTSYSMRLAMGTGRYTVDVWLLDRNKVVDWYSQVIDAQGWPEFSGLRFDKSSLLANDALDVSLTVRPLLLHARACMVYARAIDTLGRVVSEAYEMVPPEAGPVGFTLGFADLIAPMVKVEVFVVDRTRLPFTHWDVQYAAYGAAWFPVRTRAGNESFRFIVNDLPGTEYNTRAALKLLARHGVDTVHGPATAAARFLIGEAGLQPIPELTRYDCERAVDGVIRAPCLTDPAFLAEETAKVQAGAALFSAGGSGIYSLGDGNCLISSDENVCQAPSSLEGFREALEDDYGTIEALNAAWGSDFRDWAQVRPFSQEQAAVSGHFAGWIDFRHYMDRVFAGIHLHGRSIVRAVDRRARVGFRARDGSGPYLGYDWSQLASQLEFLVLPNDQLTIEKARSFRRPTGCIGVTVSELIRDDPTLVRWLPWHLVFHQMSAAWWDVPVGDALRPAPHGALLPDGRSTPTFEQFAEAIAEVRASGLDALLLEAEREHAGIAIYASRASYYVNLLEPSFGCDSLAAETGFSRLLEDLGYQYDFVSLEQVKRGGLKRYRLLIMPMARALSDEEVDAVRRFHADGGHLLADVAPGQYDDHGVARSRPPLDELFGVRHTGPVQAGPVCRARVEPAFSGEDVTVQSALEGVVADCAVRAAGAKAVGWAEDVPVWLVQATRRYPRRLPKPNPGMAVLVNHALPSYPGHAPAPNDKILKALIGGLLKQVGLEPIVPSPFVQDRPFRTECFAFRYGKGRILALLCAPGKDRGRRKTSLRLGAGGHVYDMRRGEAVRRPNKVRVRLAPGEPCLFADLPYEVTEVRLVAPETVAAGRRLPFRVSVKTKEELPGKHLVHVEFAREGEARLPYYARNVPCPNGEGEAFLPLALNEAPGAYTLEVRDVLTGLLASTIIEIKPR